jgi:hypothetical protein
MKARSAIKRMKKVVTGVAWYTGVPWSKYTYEHLGWMEHRCQLRF